MTEKECEEYMMHGNNGKLLLEREEQTVKTNLFGDLNKMSMYYTFKIPTAISHLNRKIKNHKIPFKIKLEFDEDFKDYSEEQKQFYKNNVIRKWGAEGTTEEEHRIFFFSQHDTDDCFIMHF
jgi:hypothetical protein